MVSPPPSAIRLDTQNTVGEGGRVNDEEAAADEQGSVWGSAES